MDINTLLQEACQRTASALYLTTSSPPFLRVSGKIVEMSSDNVTAEDIKNIRNSLLSERQQKTYQDKSKLILIKNVEDGFKARLSFFEDTRGSNLSCKITPCKIVAIHNLPPVSNITPESHNGVVIIAGLAGMGKSNTVANIINNFNEKYQYRILSIEEKIGYLHQPNKSTINQLKAPNAEEAMNALEFAKKGDYDIIAVDVYCRLEIIKSVIEIAATRKILIFLSINACSLQSTLAYIINANNNNRQIHCLDCATVLEAIMLQILVAKKEGEGMVGAFELLHTNSTMRKSMEEGGDPKKLDLAIQVAGRSEDSSSMQDSLKSLVTERVISLDAVKIAERIINKDAIMKNIEETPEKDNEVDESVLF